MKYIKLFCKSCYERYIISWITASLLLFLATPSSQMPWKQHLVVSFIYGLFFAFFLTFLCGFFYETMDRIWPEKYQSDEEPTYQKETLEPSSNGTKPWMIALIAFLIGFYAGEKNED